ncbi:DUF4180 domain-containing protein [Nonomuraea antri]|uniref:DUF4180 domain-containing protein n=1 Tax=Nonomuraea antri TaxID=2730852 RepID=UPI001F1A6707|nr:DUF4180 domain-containing protein [Nonomuraea antri]
MHGFRTLICPADGALINDERAATDILGDAFGHDAEVVVIPVSRLSADFFRLSTRIAGEIMQKFVTYRRLLVVVGDIAEHVEASKALRDLVFESNRGEHVWFLPDLAALEERLSRRQPV